MKNKAEDNIPMNEYAIYITAKSALELEAWTIAAARLLTDLLGGATVTEGQGYWQNGSKIGTEKTYVVSSIAIEAEPGHNNVIDTIESFRSRYRAGAEQTASLYTVREVTAKLEFTDS